MLHRFGALAALLVVACSSSPDSSTGTTPDASGTDGGHDASDAAADAPSEAGGAGGGAGTDASGGAAGAAGGGAAGAAGTDAGSDAADDADSSTQADVTLTFPSFVVPAGQELTKCVVVRMGNLADAHVGSIHNVLSAGVFRFLVYTVDDAVEAPAPADCQALAGVTNGVGNPLIMSVQADDTLTLPPDVAFKINANQMVRLELQAYNPTASDVTATVTSTFGFRASAAHDAGLLFLLEPNINVPAGGTLTTNSAILPDTSLANARYFGFIGYENGHGVGVTLGVGPSGGPYSPLYVPTTYNWDAPPRVTLGAPLTFATSNVFGLSCTWNNTGGSTALHFGTSPADEVCMAGAYYYEDVGPKLCMPLACAP